MVVKYGRRKSYGKSRRWFFKGGANLPFIGKTSVSFGSGKARRSMYAIAKKAVRNTIEPKRHIHDIVGHYPTNNTIYTHNLTELLTKGTDDDQRFGERTYLKNAVIKIVTNSLQVAENADYGHDKYLRVMLIKHRQATTSAGGWAAVFGATQLFEDSAAVFQMTSPLCKEAITQVLVDKKFKISSGDTSKKNETKHLSLSVPINSSFQFDDQAVGSSTFGRNWNLYLVYCVQDVTLPTTTPISSSTNTMYHLNFADSK